MMAADLDQAYTRWAHEELSDPTRPPHEKSIAQMLDHGSISFGRFAIDSLSWEKRSVFTHNRRQEELEQFKAPGLVAQKKAYFEEYYRKIRSLKALAGDGQQAGDVMDAGNNDVHSQTAAADGCESSLMSMKSLTDISTVSYEKCSYESCGKQEKNVVTDFGCLGSEAATSSSNSSGKSIHEIELERNSSNVSQITHLDSDSMAPYVVQPKRNETELENHSSNVSQITQIDTDSVVQFLDQSDANINDAGVVHLEIEPNSDHHSKLEENNSMHNNSGKGSMENENHTAACEVDMGEAMTSIYPFEPSGVSQLTDVDHMISEGNDSSFTIEPKHAPDPYEEKTKIVMRPSARMKKSTTASSRNHEPSNQPGSSRSLRGFNIQQECGSLARNQVNHGPIKRPGSSRSHQGFRDQQDSGTSARKNMNEGTYNRPGSSLSHQGLGNQQESGSLARNNRPGSSRSHQGLGSRQESGSLARNNRPGSSRSHQGLGNQQDSGSSTRSNMNQGSSNQPGLSRSLKGFSNQQVSSTLARNNMNQEPSVSIRPGSSRSLQGLSNRPGSSRSLQKPKNLLHKTGEDQGKVASSSNRIRALNDTSPCTTSKEVQSNVTVPRPFNFATEKRLTTERRITDAPHKGDQHDNSCNSTAARLATPFQTRSFSSYLNTPKKTAADLCVKVNTVECRRQEISRKPSVFESRLAVIKGDSHLRQPVHRSINFPASEVSYSIGKYSSGVGNSPRLDKNEEKPVKTPLSKCKQGFMDGESMNRTPKLEIRKVVSSQPAHAATDKRTPRQEVKRWR